ncbi:uncharacterized protein LOC111492589 [Cucurbita maxima]|uniref:Uncharacterized protein LOC111492589 n=1 Tax=Cucurbita maxima TaxID=3661 RepID=A0A6J1KAQ2_CUCMA|nr:uncharacterized protein LOC111492589 [Cucurbita maxima]XP_022997711.1 uncharacterized protein LOC111492589 [Cucurbita maxima]
MSDLQVCSPRHHGILLGGDYSCPHLSRLPFPTLNSDPSLITSENWLRAENTAGCILRRIQPTCVAEQKRQEIVDYVQGLIRTRIGCEVFPYGSVPLKTYIPDGDIDLTAICCANTESAVVSDIHAVLKEQELNGASQFEVKDVHCIDAEVKLVKCVVQNIVVDISFNQLGGLSTLCFLERVDRIAGKDHLFKRSIILLKAWCYYESRILGAHHGLISTYALETLVLYIFHLFHGSLHSPLAVLYRFLEYFSIFDWENYCISLQGPVSKSSLPDIVAETPENGGHELLLRDDFLRNCMEMYSISSGRSEPSLRGFTLKHLNIIDPLKENNNLGRSVSRGNFYRIRSAFKYGARKLGWILLLPEERMEAELKKFFANTLDRHCWTNAEFPTSDARLGVSVQSSAPLKTYFQDKACLEPTLCIRDEKALVIESSFTKLCLLGRKVARNVQKLETAVVLDTSGTNDTPKSSSSHSNQTNAVLENTYRAPKNGFLGLLGSQMTKDCFNNDGVKGFNERCNGGLGSFDDVGKLLDLCGDYDSCFKNLRYSQICDRYNISPPTLPLSPPMSPHRQRNYPWPATHQSQIRNPNVPAGIEQNGFAMGLQSNPVNNFGTVFEEKRRPQGIGTYFPRTNTCTYRDRQSQAKGKSQGQMTRSQLQRLDCSNNQSSATPQELSIYTGGGLEFSEAEFPVLGNGKTGSSGSPPPLSYLSRWKTPHGSSSNDSWPHDEVVEPWPINPEPCDATIPEASSSSPLEQVVTSDLQGSSSSGIGSSAMEGLKRDEENNQERVVVVAEQAFHLKNDEDFPPLSH